MRGFHGGLEALFILRGLVSIQHRHRNRRRTGRLNPDRVRIRDSLGFAQREVGAIAVNVTAVGGRFGVVEGNRFDGGGGDFLRGRGFRERRNDEWRNQNDEGMTKSE
jgi:hypothetical protein